MVNKSINNSASNLVKICDKENKSLSEVLGAIFEDVIDKDIVLSSDFIYDKIYNYGVDKCLL